MQHELMHGGMTRHYETWFWLLNNLLTGVSYVSIASCIISGWRIRWRFAGAFSMFILACGCHHLVHALHTQWISHDVISSLQVVADTSMTAISVYTAIAVSKDWTLQKREH
jgi:hypothetical protein